MNNKQKSLKNIVFMSFNVLITLVLGFILPRLYVVNYGSAVNGMLSSLNQFLIYLGLFEAGIGATTLQALYGPVARNEVSRINSILSATYHYYKKTSFYYTLVLVLLSALYPLITDSGLGYWTVFGCVFFSGFGNVIVFYFQATYKVLLQAEGKNYVISNISTFATILNNLSRVIFISLGCNILTVITASFFISILQAVFLNIYIKKNYKCINIKSDPDYSSISQKNYMLIHQISGMVFQNTDMIILTITCGLQTVSVYSIYRLVTSHLESFLNIVSNSFNFYLGQTFQVNIELFKKRIDIFERIYSTLLFATGSVLFYLYIPFMKLYISGISDVNYIDELLAFLFVLVFLLTGMRTPMLYTINYAGHFKLTTPQTIIESVINIVISLIGVWYFGIYGVLLGTIVALLYRTNEIILYSNRIILKRSPLNTYSIYVINIILSLILISLFQLLPEINNFIDFILYGLILEVISSLVIFFFHYVTSQDLRKFVNGIIVNKLQ